MSNYIGLYGLGVMGQSLVLNMARNGYSVAVFNKYDYEDITEKFVLSKCRDYSVLGYRTLNEFVSSLEKPRKILLMVTAGKAVDQVIDELIPFLEKGDMIADCGNSYYKDTIRREKILSEKGIHYFGVGVSGGEKGALEGPSIMPGGNREFYDVYLSELFNTISAKTEEGTPCCGYIGPNGAGHYVKMVHNGIEYGDIEIICEAYAMMKNILHMNNEEMADVFKEWNQGRLKSYLIEITSEILRRKDDEGNYIVDVILDEAGQKGTGKWTSVESLDMGIAAPTIVESVSARCLSAIKEQRIVASKIYEKSVSTLIDNRTEFLQDLEKAVYASKILSYAQGFALLKEAGIQNGWNLKLGEIALLWRMGCIIRAQFLGRIKVAFDNEPMMENLILSAEFKGDIKEAESGWRRIVASAVMSGLYIPAITASLQYFDGYCSERLPANLLQAQRDWFGAHTYRRVDQPHSKSYHTIWE